MATNVKRKKKKAEVMAEDGSMTLTGHLKELRNRLIICAVVFVVGVVVSLAYADRLIDLLTAMGRDYYEFVSIAPQEKLMQYFRVSILAGVVVTVPVAFYHIYAFAKPGLKRSESTFFKLVMLLGLILFCVGVLFAYKLMMPFMLRFLSTGIEGAEYIQTTTSIESYVNLCLTMFIIFGCVFEMPLITIILSKMGIINPQILKQVRGVAIVVIFFIAAVVTPRLRPLTVDGKTQHLIGLTHHYSWAKLYGKTTHGAVNDLTPNVGDPNSQTPEYKAFLVNIEKTKM